MRFDLHPERHGVEAFFAERARVRRRSSVASALLGVLILAALHLSQLPFVRSAIDELPPYLRFGIEGPNRVVPVVNLDVPAGNDAPLQHVGAVVATQGGAGGREGGKPAPARRRERRADAIGLPLSGIGDNTQDLIARALASQGKVPIFQSEDLVVEYKVLPEYPERLNVRGIGGRVSVLALIDTTGQVVETEVMRKSGEPEMDEAAEVAVKRYRFRPYRESGSIREVYAVVSFRFNPNPY